MTDGDTLHCGYCQAPLDADTGLDELHAIIKHVGRYHNQSWSLDMAARQRIQWEILGMRGDLPPLLSNTDDLIKFVGENRYKGPDGIVRLWIERGLAPGVMAAIIRYVSEEYGIEAEQAGACMEIGVLLSEAGRRYQGERMWGASPDHET